MDNLNEETQRQKDAHGVVWYLPVSAERIMYLVGSDEQFFTDEELAELNKMRMRMTDINNMVINRKQAAGK